jgi:formate dehydrogenase subunit delta
MTPASYESTRADVVCTSRRESPASIALHISRYWDPRMRAQIIAHAAQGGEGLSPTALAAVRTLPASPVR